MRGMQDQVAYVLIHSPLVGPLTWKLVGHELVQRGTHVIIPVLSDPPTPAVPFWKGHAGCVAQSLAQLPLTYRLVLVAHSGAGPLLPAIRQLLKHPIHAYVFVDAGIPQNGLSRLDLMRLEDPAWARSFEQMLQQGGRFPTWSVDDLREIVPQEALRQKLVAEINARSLPFFTEPIPVFSGWPDAPCAYLKFSAPYQPAALRAQQAGWVVRQLPAGHFHMLVVPEAVAGAILDLVQQLARHNTD